jgi:hypothetical protein
MPRAIGVVLVLLVLAASRLRSTAWAADRPTHVTVTVDPAPFHFFWLSRYSDLPVGTLVFDVTNPASRWASGQFEICTTPVAGISANTCLGKATYGLSPGQSASVTVMLQKGKYEYLSTVAGLAKAGMKGLIGVGVSVPTPSPPPPPTIRPNS